MVAAPFGTIRHGARAAIGPFRGVLNAVGGGK
jgi:hypothetical protein